MTVVLINIVAFMVFIGVFALLFVAGAQTKADVEVSDGALHVIPVGLSKLLSFKGRLSIPTSSITGVTTTDDLKALQLGMRYGGTGLPGIVAAGKFRSNKHGKSFAVVGKARPIVLITTTDYRYARVVFSTDDAAAVVATVQRAAHSRA